MKYIFLLLFSQTLWSQTISKDLCPDVLKAFNNIQLQQSLSSDGKKCYLGIHPRDAFETLIYRDYLLANDGLIMVFNSFAPDEGPASDGAREFYFLPQEFKGYAFKTEGNSLVVQGFQNLTLKFSLETAQLESVSDAQIQVKDEVVPENNGGVEILSFKGLYLDSGFMMRDSPSSRPSRTSVWKNTHGQECKVRNQEAFRYIEREVVFKSQEEHFKIIRSRCPKFRLD